MKVKVQTLAGKASSKEVTLDKAVFGLPLRTDVLQRVVVWQRSNAQAGTHNTLSRGEVHGTTKKPFKQKGTGNARQGSRKGPHMRGGAVAHGPKTRSHGTELPKKIRKLGLKTALSAKAAEGKIVVLEDFKASKANTKELAKQLAKLKVENALFIDGEAVNENFGKAISNIKHMDVLPQIGANVYDILNHDTLVLTVDAVNALEERL